MAVNFKLKKRRWNGMDLFFVLIAAAVIAAVFFVLGLFLALQGGVNLHITENIIPCIPDCKSVAGSVL